MVSSSEIAGYAKRRSPDTYVIHEWCYKQKVVIASKTWPPSIPLPTVDDADAEHRDAGRAIQCRTPVAANDSLITYTPL
ncbi:hypothetical protein ILUMI_05902, partial [Ignelater luminosus]